MKYMKILRILGIAVILSMLMAAIPAEPALADDIALSPNSGKIGATIIITGIGFSPSTETQEKRAIIIFAKDDVAVTSTGFKILGTDVKTYEQLTNVTVGFQTDPDEGEFETTFTVPSRLDDGSDDADVAPGTYYVYITISTADTAIRSKATFTVTAGATLDPPTPATGPAGTSVTISGSNFAASSAIVIKYDGTEILKTGNTQTGSGGSFASIITIPSSTPGVHTISVTVGSTTVTTQFTVTASATLDALTPTTGLVGTDVSITGAHFPISTAIAFKYDQTVITPKAGSTQTGSGGNFASIITIPQSTAGAHTITVTVGTASATAQFTVTGPAAPPPTPTPTTNTTAPPPPTPTPTPPASTTTLSLSQTSGSIGTNIMVGGSGLKPNAKITVKYDGKDVTSAPATDSGMFLAVFQVPPSQHGDHTITASDGVNTQKLTFTVESVAPKAPQPLMPEMGVKVKSPITFKWEEVTDNSSPVTYALQIATDEDFPEDSILLEKTEITKLQYILTEDEESALEGKEIPFYWRVRAVDAARNESEWTGAGEFFIGTGFKFTGWPLYAALGVGAVLLFLIGFLLGRRTAFYY